MTFFETRSEPNHSLVFTLCYLLESSPSFGNFKLLPAGTYIFGNSGCFIHVYMYFRFTKNDKLGQLSSEWRLGGLV